jgi:hypothetical protein
MKEEMYFPPDYWNNSSRRSEYQQDIIFFSA